jgi:hypothetical protein
MVLLRVRMLHPTSQVMLASHELTNDSVEPQYTSSTWKIKRNVRQKAKGVCRGVPIQLAIRTMLLVMLALKNVPNTSTFMIRSRGELTPAQIVGPPLLP